jgi:hypothetical protein
MFTAETAERKPREFLGALGGLCGETSYLVHTL